MKLFIQYWIILTMALVFSSNAEAQEKKNTKVRKPMKQTPIVIFVCEHGSAKSVVAAAHFNRLSKERNLNVRAISRGTNPDQEMPAGTINGLKKDGLEIGDEKPKKLSQSDFVGALRVITFCQLPEGFANATPVTEWGDVPPMSEDYNKFRDIIVERIKRLLQELGATK